MKKNTFLIFCLVSVAAFSQSKTTGNIILDSNMTANFTLNNTTSKVTLVLTGPSDRWFGLGLGVGTYFGMIDGDCVVYTSSISDRNFIGTKAPPTDNQDWVIVNPNGNTVNLTTGIRTLILERSLTTAETSNDLQMPYATNNIDLAWAKADTPGVTSLSRNHDVGFATGNFNSLGVEDFSLNATAIYPNPASGEFYIKTKTSLSKVNVYSQTGALVKTIDVTDDSKEVNVTVSGMPSGVYLLELLNDSEKSWKKIIVD